MVPLTSASVDVQYGVSFKPGMGGTAALAPVAIRQRSKDTSVSSPTVDLTTAARALVYVALATVLVWAPVALYWVGGRRVGAWLAEAEAWLLENQRLFATVSLLVFGAILALDGLVQLL